MSVFELDLCWIATGWAIYRKVKGVFKGGYLNTSKWLIKDYIIGW
jgi:hypothetical protein